MSEVRELRPRGEPIDSWADDDRKEKSGNRWAVEYFGADAPVYFQSYAGACAGEEHGIAWVDGKPTRVRLLPWTG